MGKVVSSLRSSDPHNQSLGVLLLFALTFISQRKHKLRAYTYWNWVAIAFNFANSLRWEKVLAANSMGILASYRCASADAFDDMVKLLKIDPVKYMIGDHIAHTLPAICLVSYCVKKRYKLRLQHGFFGFLVSNFSCFMSLYTL